MNPCRDGIVFATLLMAWTSISDADSVSGFPAGSTTSTQPVNTNSYSHPATGMDAAQRGDFQLGNALFRRQWATNSASTSSADGLGPLFNSRSCQRCHIKDGRGNPPVGPDSQPVSFVAQLHHLETSEQEHADKNYGNQLQPFAAPGLHGEGQISVRYHIREFVYPDGSAVELQVPEYSVVNLNHGPLEESTVLSPRIAPQMIGLGLLEAIPVDDILTLADPGDGNGDGISGRANHGYSLANKESMLGRFGWKASAPSIKDQSAVAFSVDMGLSTPLIQNNHGDCTDAQTDCIKMALFHSSENETSEISEDILDLVTFYSSNLAVPASRNSNSADFSSGQQLFQDSGCTGCHHEQFTTITDDPNLIHLNNISIYPYTDLLLHDMGQDLADLGRHGFASGREWRTSPLWGIGLAKFVNPDARYLHDGRARTIEEAILWHGGEAEQSRDRFAALIRKDREMLLFFLESL